MYNIKWQKMEYYYKNDLKSDRGTKIVICVYICMRASMRAPNPLFIYFDAQPYCVQKSVVTYFQ